MVLAWFRSPDDMEMSEVLEERVDAEGNATLLVKDFVRPKRGEVLVSTSPEYIWRGNYETYRKSKLYRNWIEVIPEANLEGMK